MFFPENFQDWGCAGGGDENFYRRFALWGDWLVRKSSSSLERVWIWRLQVEKHFSSSSRHSLGMLVTSRKESRYSRLDLIQHLIRGRWERNVFVYAP